MEETEHSVDFSQVWSDVKTTLLVIAPGILAVLYSHATGFFERCLRHDIVRSGGSYSLECVSHGYGALGYFQLVSTFCVAILVTWLAGMIIYTLLESAAARYVVCKDQESESNSSDKTETEGEIDG